MSGSNKLIKPGRGFERPPRSDPRFVRPQPSDSNVFDPGTVASRPPLTKFVSPTARLPSPFCRLPSTGRGAVEQIVRCCHGTGRTSSTHGSGSPTQPVVTTAADIPDQPNVGLYRLAAEELDSLFDSGNVLACGGGPSACYHLERRPRRLV
jgi:hypothetical protein